MNDKLAKGNFVRAIRTLLNNQNISPFLVYYFCAGVFSSTFYELIKKTIGDSVPKLLLFAITSLSIFLFVALVLSFKFKKESEAKFDILTDRKHHPQQHKGLILLVSRQQPCQVAIDFHLGKLERCWLICSLKTLPIAQAIVSIYRDRLVFEDIKVINDIHDPGEYARTIDAIYDRPPQGWRESDIIADFAGMTANGSVGMALTCANKNRPLQYTPAVVDKDGNITGSAAPIEIELK
jgi:hypothetical protein